MRILNVSKSIVLSILLFIIVSSKSGVLFLTLQAKHLCTSALKDLKEIKGFKTDADMREQEARIRNLERQAEADDASKDIEVHIGSEAEEYSG